ncbi:hypothetical protein B0H65DRAFT_487193 [Neurospora tetraspora]|uniref:Uncharacterized protein n=1 Tax=Neurospora tetraspora TaxID=94610 RepID=A0AAE0MV60_9PEZI|nr:hypothetical protein B0H65DRAFT_487193 [Neurospora tetraspora]
MDNPSTTAGDSPPSSSPPQPQESILNRKILPRGLPHSFSSNLNRDVTTPKKSKANNRSVRSIIASFESAASKHQPPHSPLFEPITPRCSTIRSSASTGASLTSFRRVKGSRGVSECHDARNSRNGEGDEWGEGRSDAGTAVEGIRSVSTPVIPRISSIMPFAVEEEDSLTLLNYKSYFNQPLARCLDGFVDLEEGKNSSEEEKSKKENDEKKLSTKAGIDKENIPLRITKRKDRVKTAAQTETQPTTSAPRPVRRQSRRPSLTHRKSSASVIALEKLMHELENFSVNPPFEEEESEIIAMAEDKPIIRRDPKEVQDYWWTVRRNLWVDEHEVYNPEAYHESNIAASSDIPKIQLPLPGTTDVSARASCAFDKQIPLPAPPIPFRSPNRLSSAGRSSPSSMGTPTRLPNRSISSNSSSPLKYSVLTAGHPPPSPSASVRPEPPTPLSPPALFRQSPSPPPRSSNRPVSPPLSTAGKDDYSNGDTSKATQAIVSDLRDSLHDHIQSRGPSSSSLDVNASTSQADRDSASEYGDEEVREQKAEDNNRRRTQPEGPSLDEIDGLFSRIPTDSAVSSPATAVDVGGSQENTPKAESAFDQIKKRIESREEKKRSTHSRHSSLVRLSARSPGDSSEHQQPHQSPKEQQQVPQQSQPQEEQESPNRHSDSHSQNRRHSRRRLHLSAMNLPGLRHLRSRHSKSSLSSPDSVDSLKTPTTANSVTSISSTRATISSPVPILSAGISNPGSSIPSSIPYSATRSARSSLASIIESGTGRSSQDQGHKTLTDKGGEDIGMETAVGKTEASGTVVFYPMQFVTKVPKLEEAPKGGGGFRGHFRRRNKSRDETNENKGAKTSILKDRNVEEFLNLHKKNSPGKEGNGAQQEATAVEDGSKRQNEGRNDLRQPCKEKTQHRVGSKEGTTGITSSTSASSIPLPTHRFGRSQGQFQGTTHHLPSFDDNHNLCESPSRGSTDHHDHTTPTQIPDPKYANTISSFIYYTPIVNTTNNTKNSHDNNSHTSSTPDTLPSTRRPITTGGRSREDHLSEIESFLNKDSFHSLQSMRSLHSQSRSLHSMHSIPESNSTGSMYSQDEEEKREDASVLIGEVLETVRSLGEEVVANQAKRRG